MDNKWQKIKLILLDVDGVLTDGKLYYTSDGQEIKNFNVKDGRGIIEAVELGIKFGVVTARESAMVSRRVKELGIEYVFQDVGDKAEIFVELTEKYNFKPEEIMFIGDDILDLPIMVKVGVTAVPADAAEDLKKMADFVSAFNGGDGAVREIIEKILKEQSLWDKVLERYTGIKV